MRLSSTYAQASSLPTMDIGIMNIVAPVIATDAVIGTQIAGDDGTWVGYDILTYQWERKVGTWVEIAGATSKNYTPTDEDFGYALRLVVSVVRTKAYSNSTNLTEEEPEQVFTEMLTNPDMDWSGGELLGWTLSLGDYGTDPGFTEVAPGGGAGTGAVRILSTSSQARLLENNVATVGNYYVSKFNVSAYTSGTGRYYISDGSLIDSTAVETVVELYRAGGGTSVNVYGQVPNGDLVVDSANNLEITLNDQLTAPSANMNIKFYYTLPVTPKQGTEVRVYTAIEDFEAGNYWEASLYYTGSQWDINLYRVADFGRATVLTANAIGTTDGIRVIADESHMYLATTSDSGSTWDTYGSWARTLYTTAREVNVIVTDDVTPGRMTFKDPYVGPTWYVAADGEDTAEGSINDPFSLVTAMEGKWIQPGDTVYLRGGIYTHVDTDLYANVTGSASAQVTLTNYPGEEVRLRNFAVWVHGDYIRWISYDYGLIRDNTDADRTTLPGPVENQAAGWKLIGDTAPYAAGSDVINTRIEDVKGSGISDFGPQDRLLYGNMIFNCGVVDAGGGHGPCYYANNSSYDHEHKILNAVSLNSFRATQIGDGGGHNEAYNFTVEDYTSNVSFFAGSSPFDNLVLRRVWVHGLLQLGRYTSGSGSALIEDSVIDDRTHNLMFWAEDVDELTFRRCTFTASTYTLVEPPGGTVLTLEDCETGVSTGQYINCVPNLYATNFATLSVFDFDEVGSVNATISNFMSSGTVRVHNVMLWSEYQDLTVTAGVITLPMTGWTTPIPLGFAVPQPENPVYDARFGAFVLERL